jgi:hypothetical protein
MDKASAETRHGDLLPVKLSTHALDFHAVRPDSFEPSPFFCAICDLSHGADLLIRFNVPQTELGGLHKCQILLRTQLHACSDF